MELISLSWLWLGISRGDGIKLFGGWSEGSLITLLLVRSGKAGSESGSKGRGEMFAKEWLFKELFLSIGL